MRILSTVIKIATYSVSDAGQDFTMRNGVAAQAVSDEALRLVLQPVQKQLEETLGRSCIPAILHKDIKHDPMLDFNTVAGICMLEQ